jgi:hypothetical protein
MENPAVGALAVPDAAPVLELANHLDWKAGAREDPKDRLICAGPAADIDFVRFQADETGYGETRTRALLGHRDDEFGRRQQAWKSRQDQSCEKETQGQHLFPPLGLATAHRLTPKKRPDGS